MTFDELMDAACDETKKVVMKLKPEKLGFILKDAIDQIDSGSVESVDALVRKALNN